MRWVSFLLISALTTSACGRGLPAVDTSLRSAAGPILVVANQEHGVATIVDLIAWRLVAHVDVDMNPHEAAASPDGRTVALASPSTWRGDARKIAVIDARSASLLRSLDLGSFQWPHGLAFLDSTTLVVSSRARSGIVFIDAQSGDARASAEAPGSKPYLLHAASATGHLYTSSPATNAIQEYDVSTRAYVRGFAIPNEPSGFNVSPDGRTLWISTGTHDGGGTIVVFDVTSGATRAHLPLRGYARRLAFTGGGSRVVATDVVGNGVLVFDTETARVIGEVALGAGTGPSGVACDPAAARCYVTTMRSGELIEIDAAALRVVRRLDVGSGADGVALVGGNGAVRDALRADG